MPENFHFRSYDPDQTLLFPQRIDRDIPKDDPVRILKSVIESLDLSGFKKLYHERGRSPYHPQMMLMVIVYSYMNNVYSCRKIEKLLYRDIYYIWLSGYQKPDFATINRFRNRVKNEIGHIFTLLVLILVEKGFVTLEVEYLDGTKIESKANKYTFVGTVRSCWRKSVCYSSRSTSRWHKTRRPMLPPWSLPPRHCARSPRNSRRHSVRHLRQRQRKRRPRKEERTRCSKNWRGMARS